MVLFCESGARAEDRRLFSAMPVVVPRLPTPLALASLPGVIEAAFGQLGSRLTPIQRVNLAALVAIETNRGRSVQNGNVGNISAGESFSGPVWRPPWFEVTEASSPRDVALHAAMLAGRAPRAFKAYGSVQEGAKDFARFLLQPAYAPLMRAAASSDVDAFRAELAALYSGDYKNPAATRSLAQLVAELGGAPAAGAGAAVVVLLLGLLALRAWWRRR
jgi:hypothetical protein